MMPPMNNPMMAMLQMARNGGNPMQMLQQMAGQNPHRCWPDFPTVPEAVLQNPDKTATGLVRSRPATRWDQGAVSEWYHTEGRSADKCSDNLCGRPTLKKLPSQQTPLLDRSRNRTDHQKISRRRSNDFRVIEEAAANGNKRAQLALNMFHYKVRRVIGAFAAVMGGVDAIIFTAGIGENGIGNRDAICNGLEYLGTRIDSERNNVRGKEQEISAEGSKVKIFVIPTNEEIMIARDTQRITAALKK